MISFQWVDVGWYILRFLEDLNVFIRFSGCLLMLVSHDGGLSRLDDKQVLVDCVRF